MDTLYTKIDQIGKLYQCPKCLQFFNLSKIYHDSWKNSDGNTECKSYRVFKIEYLK